MSCQFSFYSIFIIFIHLFGLYYTFIFCSIYIKSIEGWIVGVSVNIIIDFCLSGILVPVFVAIFRKILQAFRLRNEETNHINMKSMKSAKSVKRAKNTSGFIKSQ